MRREHDLVILAVQRLGRDLGDEPIEVAEGDALLLHGRLVRAGRAQPGP